MRVFLFNKLYILRERKTFNMNYITLDNRILCDCCASREEIAPELYYYSGWQDYCDVCGGELEQQLPPVMEEN